MLSDSTEENKGQIYANLMLQKSVLSDINDEKVYQEIVALAIIGKIITTPFMTLVESKTFATHILDKHFYQLQIDLKHWSSTIVFSWDHPIKCCKVRVKLSVKFSLRTRSNPEHLAQQFDVLITTPQRSFVFLRATHQNWTKFVEILLMWSSIEHLLCTIEKNNEKRKV